MIDLRKEWIAVYTYVLIIFMLIMTLSFFENGINKVTGAVTGTGESTSSSIESADFNTIVNNKKIEGNFKPYFLNVNGKIVLVIDYKTATGRCDAFCRPTFDQSGRNQLAFKMFTDLENMKVELGKTFGGSAPTISKLAEYFSYMGQNKLKLSDGEKQLQDFLLNKNLLRKEGNSFVLQGDVQSIVSISQMSNQRKREEIAVHEMIHARYNIDPKFREELSNAWGSLDSRLKDEIKKKLGKIYEGNDENLKDEFGAYLSALDGSGITLEKVLEGTIVTPGVLFSVRKALKVYYDPILNIPTERTMFSGELQFDNGAYLIDSQGNVFEKETGKFAGVYGEGETEKERLADVRNFRTKILIEEPQPTSYLIGDQLVPGGYIQRGGDYLEVDEVLQETDTFKIVKIKGGGDYYKVSKGEDKVKPFARFETIQFKDRESERVEIDGEQYYVYVDENGQKTVWEDNFFWFDNEVKDLDTIKKVADKLNENLQEEVNQELGAFDLDLQVPSSPIELYKPNDRLIYTVPGTDAKIIYIRNSEGKWIPEGKFVEEDELEIDDATAERYREDGSAVIEFAVPQITSDELKKEGYILVTSDEAGGELYEKDGEYYYLIDGKVEEVGFSTAVDSLAVQQATYDLTYQLMNLLLGDYAIDFVSDYCKEEWDSSEPSSPTPQRISNNPNVNPMNPNEIFNPETNSTNIDNNCGQSTLTIATAQAKATNTTDSIEYQTSYTVTACKQDVNFHVYLKTTADAQSTITTGSAKKSETKSAANKVISPLQFRDICIKVNDNSIGNNGEACFVVVS